MSSKDSVEMQKEWLIGLMKRGEACSEFAGVHFEGDITYARSRFPELLGYISSARMALDEKDLDRLKETPNE